MLLQLRGCGVLLHGHVGLGGVALVLLQLAHFGGGESLVAGQEAVAAQRTGSTVAEEPGSGIGEEGALNRAGDQVNINKFGYI